MGYGLVSSHLTSIYIMGGVTAIPSYKGLNLRLVHNPHFWGIIASIAAVGFIYYNTFPYNERFPWLLDIMVFEFKNTLNGSFLLIPFLYTAIVFGWRGSFVVWLVCIVVILPRITFLTFTPERLFTNILFLVSPLLIVSIITIERNWRKKQRYVLAEREVERQAFVLQVFKAQDEERERIARELHDDTLQTLLVVANRAQDLLSYYDDNSQAVQERAHAEWIRDNVLNITEDLRRLTLDLRPSILDNMGLVPALRWLVDRLARESSINVHLAIEGEIRSLGSQNNTVIFRLCQEALNNVRRHSEATRVWVNLAFGPESLRITIRDNGKGFTLLDDISDYAYGQKFGLVGIQQRVLSIKGTCDINSSINKGTVVSVLLGY